jgi:His-Xaa-Ser system protein HxsD
MNQNNPLEIVDDKNAVFRINPKIYPIDVVYAAAYILMDKAFILLDGNPETEIKASIKSKGEPIQKIAEEFNSELLNYAVYKVQSEKNRDLREAIIKRILLTNEIISTMQELKAELLLENDPEQIFKRWEDRRKNQQEDPEDK